MFCCSDTSGKYNGSVSIDFPAYNADSSETITLSSCSQSEKISFKDSFMQAPLTLETMIQTDTTLHQVRLKGAISSGSLYDHATLIPFLKLVETEISNMLMENVITTAYEDWNSFIGMVLDEEFNEQSSSSLTLSGDFITDPDIDENLSLVASTKGKLGNSLILAYAVPHLQGTSSSSPWCIHTSFVSYWCLGKKSDSLPLTSCVTCIQGHPKGSVAIGTWIGDVGVWDITCTPSTFESSCFSGSKKRSAGHQQPVTQVCWKDDQLWSIGLDGTIMEWQSHPLNVLRQVTLLYRPNLKLGLGLFGMAWPTQPGPMSSTLVLTTETGLVMHVHAHRLDPALNAPHFVYKGHIGPVNGVLFHPWIPLLLTLGVDKKLHFYRLFHDTPVHTMAFASTPLSAAWSLHRPALFAVTFSEQLCLFDLTALPYQPSATLSLACIGPLNFHSTLPLLYVAVVLEGKFGVQTIRLGPKWTSVDIANRNKEMACLHTILGQRDNEELENVINPDEF
ncbi:WD repeat-containing protein 34 [Coelomomyces lativittatus]|nr:WD repeat-containing protein 34 [Coelomomyces lativittatus]KAJ1518138.1 WD repeat-containing protein 34 [Coelomomyces lativittatus]KAJ1518436.1 WD repeat-containing protein 34 [Coelomomyces lativittatus]